MGLSAVGASNLVLLGAALNATIEGIFGTFSLRIFFT